MSVVCLYSTAANQQEITVKQAWLAFFQSLLAGGWALIAVALQLCKRLTHGIGTGRAAFLAFHHRYRQAVDEQDNIRNDEFLNASGCVDTKLVDGEEVIVLRCCKINGLDHCVLFTSLFVYIDLCFEQELLYDLIGFQ